MPAMLRGSLPYWELLPAASVLLLPPLGEGWDEGFFELVFNH